MAPAIGRKEPIKKTHELPSELLELPESPPRRTAQASSNSDENIDLTEKTSHVEPCEEAVEHPLL